MGLKELTADSHTRVESHPFTKILLSGEIDKKLYSIYLYNQYQMYDLLESHLLAHGIVRDLPGIQRAGRIYDDFYELWDKLSPIPAELEVTIKYKQYLCSIYQDVDKLLAHLYVRHMGDLYGGQMIAKKVPGNCSFYRFENSDELKGLIRSRLKDSMADEANICFDFANELFDEMMKCTI